MNDLKQDLIVALTVKTVAETISLYQQTLKQLVLIDPDSSSAYPGYLASMMASELLGYAVHIYTAADSMPDELVKKPGGITHEEAEASMEHAHNVVDQEAILEEVNQLLKKQIERHTENVIRKRTQADASHN